MDRLPQIPPNDGENDTVAVLRSAFQENLENSLFPLDIAENITKYVVDDELSLKETAQNVLEINQEFATEIENIKETEQEIIKEHGEYMCNKYLLEQNLFLRELAKLKPSEIFNINPDEIVKYGLIQKSDLYPDVTRQFLDFRFNKHLHQCHTCFPAAERKKIAPKEKTIPGIKKRRKELSDSQKKIEPKTHPFLLEPKEIMFYNFDLGKAYEQTLKITNTSYQLQPIVLKTCPKFPVFSLKFHSQRVAAGMSVFVKIHFYPEAKLNLEDEVVFATVNDPQIRIPVKCFRDPPKLLGYIDKSNDYSNLIERHIPGSSLFSNARRNAVNNTIDCGSCFVTDYVLISLILSNNGTSSRFFWLSEEDFFYENIKSASTSIEFCNAGFWIYPTYFEISEGNTCEINIIFQPMYCGLHIQTLYLMCDNNTYKQLEIVGEAVCFNRNMISVDILNMAKDIHTKKGHCIFLGHARYRDFIRFTLCITNHSSLILKYEIHFDSEEKKFDMQNWIQIINATPVLAPYSVTDIHFHVTPDKDENQGYYKTDLRLFVQEVPIASLDEHETFLVRTRRAPLKEIVENLRAVDILLVDVTVACFLEPKPVIPKKKKSVVECMKCGKRKCVCTDCDQEVPQADLVFSESLIDLGILPTGVDLKKEFYIMNMGNENKAWKIIELKYNLPSSPHLEKIPEDNLSIYTGELSPGKKQDISYDITKKQPTRWVSILVLFSVTFVEETKRDSLRTIIQREKSHSLKPKTYLYTLVAESICVVTYETIKLDIVFKTGLSHEPILCPLQMLYTGVPVELSFEIQNFSLIGGCFYFYKPVGKDADKVDVKYQPQFGELKPRSKVTINLELTCNDVGILDNVFIPCFVGQGQKPELLRLLCVVDCIHVFFYLPNKDNEYEKILWPPKVLYEYDRTWSQYCMCEETLEGEQTLVQNIQSDNTIKILEKSSKTLNHIKESRSEVETSKSQIKSSSSEIKTSKSDMDNESSQHLLKTVVNIDSEVFLQECVMQVENVLIKQPRRITIFIENVTPKSAKYTIQSANYSAKENLIEDAITTRYKTTEELWEPMIEKQGILVHPEIEAGVIRPHELIYANIWIYANTWGIYAEEIVVDIEDISCFAFSLLIEVVGCPLHIPLGVGAITRYPTVRFGSIAVGDDDVTKNILMLNTSSVDVKISWHIFYCYENLEEFDEIPFNFICDVIQKSEEKLEFDFTERFYGFEGSDCIEILPSQWQLASKSKTTLPITFKPSSFKEGDDKSMRCYILGRIFLAEEDRFKSSYFYRKINSVIIEVTAAIETPCLDIIAEAENNTLYVYANEVTLNRDAIFHISLLARNTTSSVIQAQLDCGDPFACEHGVDEILLKPGQCHKVKLLCLLTHEKICKWAPLVYGLTEASESYRPIKSGENNEQEDSVVAEVRLPTNCEKEVNEEKKMLTLHRKLFVYYKGGLKDVIPLSVCIFYPNITVKPIHVKFGYILLGRTQKSSVSVFNLTGYKVLFEVLKSTSSQEIIVTPCYGEIEKSTGMNHSFATVTIYFTPRECRSYQESIRICTNIQQYYIDIPVKGAGSFNEKFDVGS